MERLEHPPTVPPAADIPPMPADVTEFWAERLPGLEEGRAIFERLGLTILAAIAAYVADDIRRGVPKMS
jgi:hypothetical protein